MFVQQRTSDLSTISGPASNWRKLIASLNPHIDAIPLAFYPHREATPFSAGMRGTGAMIRTIREYNPDIVNVHWVNHGFLTIGELSKIRVPTVVTMHDMWQFTGGCHYNNLGCDAYVSRCGRCPLLHSRRLHDLSRAVWRRKRRSQRRSWPTVYVAPSRWLASEALRSSLLNSRSVNTIPNTIDTERFKPIPKESARALFGLPTNKPIILFGAIGPFSDENKGYRLLSEAISRLRTTDVHMAVFGATQGPPLGPSNGHTCAYVGNLRDSESLVALYSAADVVVVPSKTEAFGQTASEAMSCGKPVVAFATTGLLDIVDHMASGYLARPFDADDLAKGIDLILSGSVDAEAMGAEARRKAVASFDYRVVAASYLELFQKTIDMRTGKTASRGKPR